MLHCLSQVFCYLPDFSGVKFWWRTNPAGLGTCIVHYFSFARVPFSFLWRWCTDSLIDSIGLIPDSPQPDYKWKEQARTDTGTGSLVQTSRNFIKQNLLLHLCKSLVLMTASPSIIFRCCSGRSTFRWCSEMCKNSGDFVSCRPFCRGECFTIRMYLPDKSKPLST